ncbi:3-hydroxyacyl-CoA dehydrogenase family protein, partial [Curtobacterium oceanosedimentum]|uniref:3-hydroxyacyl-CoA dehydrogenase family protein n=1 Tax=Curtobacterium oceanosedimentum TaxID=465820 RepID=UPI000A59D6BA
PVDSGVLPGSSRVVVRGGLDGGLDIEEHNAADDPHRPEGPRRLLRGYVDAGHFGVKTGRGFYRYDD